METSPATHSRSLSFNENRKIFKGFRSAGSDSTGGNLSRVPVKYPMYYVYVLKSRKDGRFYMGCTADLRKRVAEHGDGKVRSTSHRLPFDLLYYAASWNHTDALHR